MNCREFEAVTSDLARDQVIDAAARESAALHAETCAPCARRLSDERSLAAGLAALAVRDDSVEAPARLEAALLEAFREQSRVSFEPAVSMRRRLSFRLGWVAAAAAAVILLIFAIGALRVERTAPVDLQAKEQKPPPPEKKEKGKTESEPGAEPESKTEPPAPREKKKKFVLLQANGASNRTVKKDSPRSNGSAAASDEEIATRFLPLTFANNLEQMEGGQLVRVEMPRSAMISFGLPINLERANERIKADVLIGNDGVAHAIRFVR